jgi:hypothetical protein
MTNLKLPPCRQLLKDSADGKLGIKITSITHKCHGCDEVFPCEKIFHANTVDEKTMRHGFLLDEDNQGQCDECWDWEMDDLGSEL